MSKAQEIVNKIAYVIRKHQKVDDAQAKYLAEKIYADVVAAHIDEEINRWFMVVYSDLEKLDS